MQLNDQEQQRAICYYILSYLSDNSDASDTLDGIVEWWLLNQRLKFETRNVSEALDGLVSEGLILKREESGSRVSYRINRTKVQVTGKLLVN